MGGVVVHGNLVPGRVKEMIGFYKEGDVEAAHAIDEELKPLVDALGVTINPIPVKAALNLLGHEVGGLRLPLVEATDDELPRSAQPSTASACRRRRAFSCATRKRPRPPTAAAVSVSLARGFPSSCLGPLDGAGRIPRDDAEHSDL